MVTIDIHDPKILCFVEHKDFTTLRLTDSYTSNITIYLHEENAIDEFIRALRYAKRRIQR